MLRKYVAPLSLSLVLVACGGGGGGESSTAAVPAPSANEQTQPTPAPTPTPVTTNPEPTTPTTPTQSPSTGTDTTSPPQTSTPPTNPPGTVSTGQPNTGAQPAVDVAPSMSAMLTRMLNATQLHVIPGRGPLCYVSEYDGVTQICDPTATDFPVTLVVDRVDLNAPRPRILMQASASGYIIYSMILSIEGMNVSYVEDTRTGDRQIPWEGNQVLLESGGDLVSTPAPILCDNGQCPQIFNPDVYVPMRNWVCIRQGGSFQRPTVCLNGVTNKWYVSSAGRSAASPPLIWGQID